MNMTADSSNPDQARPCTENDVLVGLIAGVARRDESAFTRLYEATKRRVFGLALAICGDSHAADETTLEAFTQIWRRAETFDRERGDPWTWMLSIARTRCIDLIRARTRHASRHDPLENCAEKACGAATVENQCMGAESAMRVRKAVERLPVGQREAIQTAYFGGLSYSETAEALGVPVGTIKTRIRAALGELRQALRDDGEENP
jgi:RNA polymerase sigma-70 factor (ECF subfamily)